SDVTSYLPDCLLVKTDIATMGNGLEARSPFLDHRFMEWAARLPIGLKLRGGRTKWILRRALRGLVPRETLGRPKMGFNLPLDGWLRGELRAMAHDLLLAGMASHALAADEIHWTFTGPTSVTFDWRGADSTIHYGLDHALEFTATGVTPSPLPFSSAGPFWEARITGLLPGATYHYSIEG